MTYFVIPSEGFTVVQGIIQHPPKRPNPGPPPNPPPNYPPPPTPTQPPPKTNGLGTLLGPPPVQPGPRPSPAGPVPIPPVPPRPRRDGIVGWDEPMDGCPIAQCMTSVKGKSIIGVRSVGQDGEPDPEPEPAPTPNPEPEPDRPEPDVPQSPTPDDIMRPHTCGSGANHGHALVPAHTA